MRHIDIFDYQGNSITSLVQWDLDVYVYIKDSIITEAHRVHFFNQKSEEALIVESTYSNGVLRAKIPNVLLTTPLTIYGYVVVYIGEDQTERSLYGFSIEVRNRPKPSDYIEADNPDYITVTALFEQTKNEIINTGNQKKNEIIDELNSFSAQIAQERQEFVDYSNSQKQSLIDDITVSVSEAATDRVVTSATSVVNESLSDINVRIDDINSVLSSAVTVSVSNTSFNDYVAQGNFFFSTEVMPTENVPGSCTSGFLSVITNETGNFVKQFFYCGGNTSNNVQTYVRTYCDGTWRNWSRILDTTAIQLNGTPLTETNGMVNIPAATESNPGVMTAEQVAALTTAQADATNALSKFKTIKISGTTNMYGVISMPDTSYYPIASLSRNYAICGDHNSIRVISVTTDTAVLAKNAAVDFLIVGLKK